MLTVVSLNAYRIFRHSSDCLCPVGRLGFERQGGHMKIRHVLGPLPLILFASTAFGQDEPIRNPLTLKWGEPIEKQPGLTLLDEKWFPPFDDKLFLPRTAMAQALVPGTEEWKSRPYLADRGDGIHTS